MSLLPKSCPRCGNAPVVHLNNGTWLCPVCSKKGTTGHK